MRPRPEGRGEREGRPHGGRVGAASMRPRPEGRGERRGTKTPWRRDRGFNAATTRRPWRTTTDCAVMLVGTKRFNAATTRRPWRTSTFTATIGLPFQLQCGHDPKAVENVTDLVILRKRPAGASMRPRPEGRGELGPVPQLVEGVNLLQCGHDPKAVENDWMPSFRRKSRRSFNAATTRRPWRTGNEWPDRQPARAISMRPRPEGRGEPARPATGRRRRCLLQCGHDPKAVENGETLNWTFGP